MGPSPTNSPDQTIPPTNWGSGFLKIIISPECFALLHILMAHIPSPSRILRYLVVSRCISILSCKYYIKSDRPCEKPFPHTYEYSPLVRFNQGLRGTWHAGYPLYCLSHTANTLTRQSKHQSLANRQTPLTNHVFPHLRCPSILHCSVIA